jgi:hypothetical protein
MEYISDIFEKCKTERVSVEYRYLPTDEEMAAGVTERWVEASGGPVKDENGQIVMLSGKYIDVILG